MGWGAAPPGFSSHAIRQWQGHESADRRPTFSVAGPLCRGSQLLESAGAHPGADLASGAGDALPVAARVCGVIPVEPWRVAELVDDVEQGIVEGGRGRGRGRAWRGRGRGRRERCWRRGGRGRGRHGRGGRRGAGRGHRGPGRAGRAGGRRGADRGRGGRGRGRRGGRGRGRGGRHGALDLPGGFPGDDGAPGAADCAAQATVAPEHQLVHGAHVRGVGGAGLPGCSVRRGQRGAASQPPGAPPSRVQLAGEVQGRQHSAQEGGRPAAAGQLPGPGTAAPPHLPGWCSKAGCSSG
jgi:hypothetical protein